MGLRIFAPISGPLLEQDVSTFKIYSSAYYTKYIPRIISRNTFLDFFLE